VSLGFEVFFPGKVGYFPGNHNNFHEKKIEHSREGKCFKRKKRNTKEHLKQPEMK
jgi:hypothetical protein